MHTSIRWASSAGRRSPRTGRRRAEAATTRRRPADPPTDTCSRGAATAAFAALLLLLAGPPVGAQPGDRRQAVVAVAAPDLRVWDDAVDRRLRTGELRRYAGRPGRYVPNLRSERLAQYHRGIPVYGADLVRQTDAGVSTAILGTLFTGIDVDPTPGLTMAEARAAFDAAAGPSFGLVGTPSLWVFPLGEGAYTLAWRGLLSNFRDVFIDARSGETLFEFSRIRDQGGVGLGTGVLGDRRKMATESLGGTFRARDRLRPAVIETFDLENDGTRLLDAVAALFAGARLPLQNLAADGDDVWEDGTVVDVHSALGWSYDYLATRLGWAGIDGRDGTVIAMVHPADPARVERDLAACRANTVDPSAECGDHLFLQFTVDNALYYPPFGIGAPTGLLVFGEPSTRPRPLTALDVVAHEMAHGVTRFTARLGATPPPNEPGAISEAFSDIIGTAIEFHVQEAGDGPLRADYAMGEDSGLTLRSLRDPGAVSNRVTGPYPDHYDDLYRGPANSGGIHINATILGHAYFLAVEGGVNRTSGVRVTGVGHENRLQIERTFFNAWLHLVPSFADHAMVGESLIRSATDLFGPAAAPVAAIRNALDAVGIPRAAGRPRTFKQNRRDSGDCR